MNSTTGRKKLLVLCPNCPGWPEWPLGMAYVLACLEREGFPFDFIDLTTVVGWETQVVRRLRSEQYLAVATGGLISFHRFFRRLRELVRQHAPATPLILGGNIIKDANDDLLFNQLEIDYGVYGEAETCLPRFLPALERGERDFTGYDGVFFRNAQGQVVRNGFKRLVVRDDDTLPAWRHFDTAFYIRHASFGFVGQNLRYMPIISGRGCVGKCGFCSPTIGGFRKRALEHVMAEVRHLTEHYDFDTLCFMNEMFYPTAREVREFCLAYRQLPVRKPWFVQIRIDARLDVETLRMMKDAGCCAISAGIESGSDKILGLMNKRTTAADITEFFRNCCEAGLPAGGTFIVGYEGETAEDLRKTIDLMITEDINTGEALLFVYQGTEVYRHAMERGLIADERAHLDNMSGELFAPDAIERFVNLTAMPTPHFFEVAAREVRRFNTHLYENHHMLPGEIRFTSDARYTRCTLNGFCRECGEPTSQTITVFGRVYLGVFSAGVNRNWICRKCFRPITLKLAAFPQMSGLAVHLCELGPGLAQCHRIVLAGMNHDLPLLLRVDLIGLNYECVVGVLPLEDSAHRRVLDYPVLDEQGLLEVRPDAILYLDPFADASALAHLFEQNGLPVPNVFQLIDAATAAWLRKESCATFRVANFLSSRFGLNVPKLLAAASRRLVR